MDTTLDQTSNGSLTVGKHPVTLSVPAGAAIFALRGEAWVTQEGLRDDIIVAPGQSFMVRNHGALVVSATRAPADLLILRPAAARAYPAADIYDFARSHALQLRRDAIARAWASAVTALRSLVTRLGAHVVEPRRVPRSHAVDCHCG